MSEGRVTGGAANLAARGGLTERHVYSRSVSCVRAGLIGLGVVGALLGGEQGVAQTTPGSARLTVRPRAMATGTQNPEAGEYRLDSVPDYLVSVPQQCVGARRCPLFIFLPGGGYGSRQVTDWLRPAADKYGMILLAPTRSSGFGYGVFDEDPDRNNIDRAMKQILRRFAIDPDRIAIVGRCGSSSDGVRLGIDNLDVFNRIVSISGGVPTAGMDPQNKTVEFLVDAGFLEYPDLLFKAVRDLRSAGHPVKHVIGLRGHEHQWEDYDFLGRWLRESWATPDSATRTVPAVIADPVPELTAKALAQMRMFWTSFSREPDSIRTTARRKYLREVVVPVGEERPSTVMVDMAALAAKYPSVAAALKAAGLTARQHEAYRVALISAQVMAVAGNAAGAVEGTSVLTMNVAFFREHLDEFKALKTTGIWRIP